MASFGKVPDLLDPINLNLQDVVGNVEPIPTLVPYHQYAANILVYRIDSDFEFFMGMMQDFTEYRSRELHLELWTWSVQWRTDDTPSTQFQRIFQNPRAVSGPPQALSVQPSSARACEKRTLDPQLFKQEELLRILIDIVQVNSTLVPNFIEFLYRWIDFYEGDGTALKAALRWEIPSLWDFDYHPQVLPPSSQKQLEQGRLESHKLGDDGSVEEGPAKKKVKPDLAMIERQAMESERLQYREVKFGIRPPDQHSGLPPLINIPRERVQRGKYYAACYKTRNRAVALIREAGISMDQVSRYRFGQSEHPLRTPVGPGPLSPEQDGLRHFYKDAEFGRARQAALMKKQMEINISNKLAQEAGGQMVSLHPKDAGRRVLQRQQEVPKDQILREINLVPQALLGKLNSQLFENAKDENYLRRLAQQRLTLLRQRDSGNCFVAANQNSILPLHASSSQQSQQSGSTLPLQTRLLAQSNGNSMLPPPTTIAVSRVGPTGPMAPTIVTSQQTGHHVGGLLQGQTQNGSQNMNASRPQQSLSSSQVQALIRSQTAGMTKENAARFIANLRTAIQQRSGSSSMNNPQTRPSVPTSQATPQQQSTSLAPRPNVPLMPIMIYFPKIVRPGNGIGPDGAKLGDGGSAETDAVLLGATQPGSGQIEFTRAVFLPLGIFQNLLKRVRKGRGYQVLEAYALPQSHPMIYMMRAGQHAPTDIYASMAKEPEKTPHYYAYRKLAQAYSIISSSEQREDELTKRWRVTKGPMTRFERGAVWEGWAVKVDKEMMLTAEERAGCVSYTGWIDHNQQDRKLTEEEMERKRYTEQLLEEDEASDSDDDDDIEMEDP